MTVDEADRMERAERIRQLRQGSGESRRGNGDDPAAGESAAGANPDTDDAGGDGHAASSETAGQGRGQPAPVPAGGGGSPEGGRNSDGGGAVTQGESGTRTVHLPDQGEMDAALEAAGQTDAADPADESVGDTARGQAGTTSSEATTRVLEFELGDELFCIDISGIEEIVKRETVTRVPNTPDHVGGVVDLRGQITTILDAKGMLDIDEAGAEALIVVFAPDAYEEHGAVGWTVDEVRQVRPVADDQVRTPPSDDDFVEGIVDREEADELVVWVRPEIAMGAAFGNDEDE